MPSIIHYIVGISVTYLVYALLVLSAGGLEEFYDYNDGEPIPEYEI